VHFLTETAEFIPALFGRTSVKDYRFAQNNGTTEYTYQISNRWPTTSDVLSDHQLRPTILAKPSKPPSAENQKLIRFIILVVFLIGLVALVLAAVKQKNSKTNNKA